MCPLLREKGLCGGKKPVPDKGGGGCTLWRGGGGWVVGGGGEGNPFCSVMQTLERVSQKNGRLGACKKIRGASVQKKEQVVESKKRRHSDGEVSGLKRPSSIFLQKICTDHQGGRLGTRRCECRVKKKSGETIINRKKKGVSTFKGEL